VLLLRCRYRRRGLGTCRSVYPAIGTFIPQHAVNTGGADSFDRLDRIYRAGVSDLSFEILDSHIGVITMDRPQARNALTHAMYAALEDAVRTAPGRGVRCLVVTGADPAFCSGDDVRQVMGAGEADRAPVLSSEQRQPRLTPAADALLHTDIPVIAAVNGAAVGWGMELALMADLRIASERARFGELFVLRGLVSDAPGLGRLAQLVGREKAAEMLFTGDIIDAAEALRIGLVGRLVAHHELLSTAFELASKIAANPPLAVQRNKAGLRRALDPDWADLGQWVSSALGELFQTDDHREGARAFLDKRPPQFRGS
jgi:enoyl-CoA hydratase/carnithine racemase